MRKLPVVLLSLYLAAAVQGLRRERHGALTCGCASECWCKKRPLSLFRWVFPVGHR